MSSGDSDSARTEFGSLCDKDIYFRPQVKLQNQTMKDLVDYCNAASILHCACSDFECWIRFKLNYSEEIKSVKTDIIDNQQTRAAVERYIHDLSGVIDAGQEEAESSEKLNMAMHIYHKLDTVLIRTYRASKYIVMSEDVYWATYDKSKVVADYDELEQKFGSNDRQIYNMILDRYRKATSFDEKCVLALVMAHLIKRAENSGAVTLLRECMQAGKYSIYLYEVWRTWRVLVQTNIGASKDSEIRNDLYNQMRTTCLQTIMKRISQKPNDNFAINEFLILCYQQNIYRYGEFENGNQYVVEVYNLFPEEFPEDE